VLLDVTGYAYTAGLSEAFHASGHVDSVTVEIIPINNHVTQADAYAQCHPLVFRNIRIPLGELPLDFHRTLNGIYRASKFHKGAIASGLENPTSKLLGFGIKNF
jgi:hypothetical protein